MSLGAVETATTRLLRGLLQCSRQHPRHGCSHLVAWPEATTLRARQLAPLGAASRSEPSVSGCPFGSRLLVALGKDCAQAEVSSPAQAPKQVFVTLTAFPPSVSYRRQLWAAARARWLDRTGARAGDRAAGNRTAGRVCSWERGGPRGGGRAEGREAGG
jgi:hypothetical protein